MTEENAMSVTEQTQPATTQTIAQPASWRTPVVIAICGCLISALAFGPRSSLGFFLTPMSQENGWGRDVFAFSLAIQNLLWGIGQPFAGAIADRFGTVRVLTGGALLYALGLAGMAYATAPSTLTLTAGALIGFGLAGASPLIVIAAFGKLLPERYRPLSFGAGTAAGSFGQFLFSPLAVALMGFVGWQDALALMALMLILIAPLSLALAAPPKAPATINAAAPAVSQTVWQAFREALGHRSYVLLVLGYFTCGFQLAFITVHMPAYLIDRGLSAQIGGWTIAVIGLFNIVGSLYSGWLSSRLPKRYILAMIYFLRAAVILAFISFPVTPVTAIAFGASMGFLWLSTVPPTSSLIQVMFGTRWLAMLVGFSFFSHQVGGFLGVLIGGIAFERTGSYDVVWWLSILLGILSALINLPIVEKPARVAAPAAA
jgi:MFS family permease